FDRSGALRCCAWDLDNVAAPRYEDPTALGGRRRRDIRGLTEDKRDRECSSQKRAERKLPKPRLPPLSATYIAATLPEMRRSPGVCETPRGCTPEHWRRRAPTL